MPQDCPVDYIYYCGDFINGPLPGDNMDYNYMTLGAQLVLLGLGNLWGNAIMDKFALVSDCRICEPLFGQPALSSHSFFNNNEQASSCD